MHTLRKARFSRGWPRSKPCNALLDVIADSAVDIKASTKIQSISIRPES
jgi:hypothetical protein